MSYRNTHTSHKIEAHDMFNVPDDMYLLGTIFSFNVNKKTGSLASQWGFWKRFLVPNNIQY